jgi:hypothetical protein
VVQWQCAVLHLGMFCDVSFVEMTDVFKVHTSLWETPTFSPCTLQVVMPFTFLLFLCTRTQVVGLSVVTSFFNALNGWRYWLKRQRIKLAENKTSGILQLWPIKNKYKQIHTNLQGFNISCTLSFMFYFFLFSFYLSFRFISTFFSFSF